MRRTLISLLALYIDFIVIGTFMALGNYFIGLALGYVAGVGLAWYGEIAAAAGLTALARLLGLSLGQALLDYALEETEADLAASAVAQPCRRNISHPRRAEDDGPLEPARCRRFLSLE